MFTITGKQLKELHAKGVTKMLYNQVDKTWVSSNYFLGMDNTELANRTPLKDSLNWNTRQWHESVMTQYKQSARFESLVRRLADNPESINDDVEYLVIDQN